MGSLPAIKTVKCPVLPDGGHFYFMPKTSTVLLFVAKYPIAR
jgi:hypothetical protein